MRTNIDIDSETMTELLKRTGLKTKREIVDVALKRLLKIERQKDILELRGIGWEGDLEKMRRDA
ncbi:MAG TPA: type II toxin-antitoxin system VapB family antitoxin [Allosphingosinicella sp.]|jgi:Arc/MetJ family transcription regulator